MKRVRVALLLGALCASVPTTFASAQQTQREAGTGGTNSTTIDELKITGNSVSIIKLLPMLKAKVPSFQYVVVDGPWEEMPVPALELRNVSISEVFQLLQRLHPEFQVETITTDGASISSGGGLGGGFSGSNPVVLIGNERLIENTNDMPEVQAISLTAAIDRQYARDLVDKNQPGQPTRKKAVNEVMSMLENVAKQAARPQVVPTLAIHDETETLVVKAARKQIEAVSTAVNTLSPMPNRAELEQAKEERAILSRQILQMEQKISSRDQELMELKIRMDMYMKQSQSQPADKK